MTSLLPPKIFKRSYITRSEIRGRRDTVFLFGDNWEEKGFGGQAKEMRGEPNAVGIPTKKSPVQHPSALLTDDEYDENVRRIELALDKVRAMNPQRIVVPANGIGTGRACLPHVAPKTHAYLVKAIMRLGL